MASMEKPQLAAGVHTHDNHADFVCMKCNNPMHLSVEGSNINLTQRDIEEIIKTSQKLIEHTHLGAHNEKVHTFNTVQGHKVTISSRFIVDASDADTLQEVREGDKIYYINKEGNFQVNEKVSYNVIRTPGFKPDGTYRIYTPVEYPPGTFFQTTEQTAINQHQSITKNQSNSISSAAKREHMEALVKVVVEDVPVSTQTNTTTTTTTETETLRRQIQEDQAREFQLKNQISQQAAELERLKNQANQFQIQMTNEKNLLIQQQKELERQLLLQSGQAGQNTVIIRDNTSTTNNQTSQIGQNSHLQNALLELERTRKKLEEDEQLRIRKIDDIIAQREREANSMKLQVERSLEEQRQLLITLKQNATGQPDNRKQDQDILLSKLNDQQNQYNMLLNLIREMQNKQQFGGSTQPVTPQIIQVPIPSVPNAPQGPDFSADIRNISNEIMKMRNELERLKYDKPIPQDNSTSQAPVIPINPYGPQIPVIPGQNIQNQGTATQNSNSTVQEIHHYHDGNAQNSQATLQIGSLERAIEELSNQMKRLTELQLQYRQQASQNTNTIQTQTQTQGQQTQTVQIPIPYPIQNPQIPIIIPNQNVPIIPNQNTGFNHNHNFNQNHHNHHNDFNQNHHSHHNQNTHTIIDHRHNQNQNSHHHQFNYENGHSHHHHNKHNGHIEHNHPIEIHVTEVHEKVIAPEIIHKQPIQHHHSHHSHSQNTTGQREIIFVKDNTSTNFIRNITENQTRPTETIKIINSNASTNGKIFSHSTHANSQTQNQTNYKINENYKFNSEIFGEPFYSSNVVHPTHRPIVGENEIEIKQVIGLKDKSIPAHIFTDRQNAKLGTNSVRISSRDINRSHHNNDQVIYESKADHANTNHNSHIESKTYIASQKDYIHSARTAANSDYLMSYKSIEGINYTAPVQVYTVSTHPDKFSVVEGAKVTKNYESVEHHGHHGHHKHHSEIHKNATHHSNICKICNSAVHICNAECKRVEGCEACQAKLQCGVHCHKGHHNCHELGGYTQICEDKNGIHIHTHLKNE